MKSSNLKSVEGKKTWWGSVEEVARRVFGVGHKGYMKMRTVLWMGSVMVIIIGVPILYAINT